MSRDLDSSARLVFGLMGLFLVLFIVSILLTTMSDDSIGASQVNLTGVTDQIKAGHVTEINQRNGIEMIIYLKDTTRLEYFRPNTNTSMTDVLQGAGITPDQLTGIKFTSGEPTTTLGTVGNLIRLVGLAGLGITAVLGYLQRRRQVLGGRKRSS